MTHTLYPKALESVKHQVICVEIDNTEYVLKREYDHVVRLLKLIQQDAAQCECIKSVHVEPDMFKKDENVNMLPDGWVMVPKEPTEKMVLSGFNSYQNSLGTYLTRMHLAYKAMIAAAPNSLAAQGKE